MAAALFKTGDVLLALKKGPLTFGLLAAEMGYVFTENPPKPPLSWWQRLCVFDDRTPGEREREQDGKDNVRRLRSVLADMTAVGLIIHAAGPPETWALPPSKPSTEAAKP